MTTGIILAGGQSRRMGQDKSLMALGGKTLIQRVIDALSPLCTELILVTNTPDKYTHLALRMVHDAFPETGSLGGLYSGLAAMSTEQAIAVACDMPFINTEVLRYLVSLSADVDAVVPDLSESSTSPQPSVASLPQLTRFARSDKSGKGSAKAKQLDLHPLHAIYRRTCLAPIEAQLRAGDLRMMGFFAQVVVRYVKRDGFMRFDPHLYSFFNVNTPEEWAEAERIVG